MATHVAVVDEEGMVRIPADGATPGKTVAVRVLEADESRLALEVALTEALKPIYHDGEELTITRATTPELKEQLAQRWLEIGRLNRALLTEDDLTFDFDAWMYDENGLPH